jgi:medium-chain acyl-[acyl-carrier-protein] hydrolase
MGAHIHWHGATGAVSLLCLPYAGGDGTTYRQWPASLGAHARVGWAELPGRGEHFGLAPLRRIEQLVQWLLPEALAVPAPLVIFGHSMGALIGYELAHALREACARPPALLALAAHHAPGRAPQHDPLHALPRDEFVRRLAAFEGTPAEVLRNAELLALMEPRLRADFEACETYTPQQRDLLPTPIVVYGGVADAEVPLETLLHWAPLTKGRFDCVLLPGHHFFLHAQATTLTRDLCGRLGRVEP